jgi:DNA-binding response OmpR family regulator
MPAADDSKRWVNFEKVSVLGLEQSAYGQKILEQMLRGFGIRRITGARSFDSAMAHTLDNELDVIIVDPEFDQGRGLEFVRALRHAETNTNRFVPIILVLGHSTLNSVNLSRNTGVNYVVAKPCTPKALLERILWVARDKRPYVQVGAYAGPDRRFKMEDLPEGMAGRRTLDRAHAETDAGQDPNDQQQRGAA